jgi:hypothetical protein
LNAAAILALVTFVALVVTKIVAGFSVDNSEGQVVTAVLGGLGLATILLIIPAIALGHVALIATRRGRKGGRYGGLRARTRVRAARVLHRASCERVLGRVDHAPR